MLPKRTHSIEIVLTNKGFEIREQLGKAERTIMTTVKISQLSYIWDMISADLQNLQAYLQDAGFEPWTDDDVPPTSHALEFPLTLARRTF